MPTPSRDNAVRQYLQALKDPNSLRDEDAIAHLRKQLDESADGLERLRLRQQLNEAERPPLDRAEQEFITHAKPWAEDSGVGVKAFQDEGVAADVLRKAGFNVSGRRGRARGAGAPRTRRSRVTAEQVRSQIPKQAPFTIKELQDISGASPAVVRKVVTEEEAQQRLRNEGTASDHRGPGRAPVQYRRV